jgi:hypothetical protein
MPWSECKPLDERLRFVARLLEGENMAPHRIAAARIDMSAASLKPTAYSEATIK